MFLQEIYEVEDCEYWNPTGVSYNSTSSTDRKVLSGLEDIEFTPKANYEVSFKLNADTFGKRLYFISKPQSTSSSNFYGFGGDIDTQYGSMTLRTTSSSNYKVNSRTNPMKFKFVFTGSTVQFYANDTLITTHSVNWIQQYAPYVFSWGIWNTGTVTASEIKVKQL